MNVNVNENVIVKGGEVLMKLKIKIKTLLVCVVVLSFLAVIAVAAPYGPRSVDVLGSDRRTEFNESVSSKEAQAGNVTRLRINTSTLTDRWQGYYGNITGIVTLQDANGFRLYEWGNDDTVTPIGEVYASNNTVGDWTRVFCVNLTANSSNTTLYGPNATILEGLYGAGLTDRDGIDETFTAFANITIGSKTMNCSAIQVYNGSASPSYNWNETLLYENATIEETTRSIIYAAQVAQNQNGFNNNTWDFQMIVGENGDISTTTTYYFYVELV